MTDPRDTDNATSHSVISNYYTYIIACTLHLCILLYSDSFKMKVGASLATCVRISGHLNHAFCVGCSMFPSLLVCLQLYIVACVYSGVARYVCSGWVGGGWQGVQCMCGV